MKEKDEIKQVAIYCRTSTGNQKEKRTIQSQLNSTHEYCAEQGWTVLHVYKDDGFSGTTPIDERPDAKRLFDNLKDYDAIVMTEDSRLTRTEDEVEQGTIQKALRLSGIYTVVVFENAIEDASTFGRRLIRAIKMIMAAEERKKILARQKAGIERAKQENRHYGGTVPYGIAWVGHTVDENGKKTAVNKWSINVTEHEVLQQAVQLIKEGHTIQNVVDLFNADPAQYPPKRKAWSHGTLWRMLTRNDFLFTGKLKGGVDTERILFTEDEIQEVRHLIKLNRRSSGRKDMPKAKPVDNFLLERMMVCECGWTLSSVAPNKGKNRYYWCKRCLYRIKADQLDTDLWAEFTKTFTDKDRLLAAVKAGDYALGTDETRKAKTDLAKAIQTLENVAERKQVIMRLLNDPDSGLDYTELKATLVDLGEKAKEAKATKQEAHLKLSNPDQVEQAVAAASKAVVRQLDQITELMATFSTIREARRVGLPVNKVMQQVREQKRAILKSEISKGEGIVVTKSGDVTVNGLLTNLSSCTGCFG